MPEVKEISSVPKDIDSNEVAKVKNPFQKDVKIRFDGDNIVIKSGAEKEFPLPLAAHAAKHLAEYKVRQEFRAKVKLIKDEKKRTEMEEKGIPNYRTKIWEEMKKILVVKSGSTFFDKPETFRAESQEKIDESNAVNLF